MLRTLVFGSLVLTVLATSAAAEEGEAFAFDNGDTLLRYCKEEDDPFASGYCMGVIIGSHDALTWGHTKFCKPRDIVVQQIRDIVVQYLDRNPEKRHLVATELVYFALKEQFPCP